MPKCIIDGKEAEFKPGENLVEVAKRVGVEIPVFCYHPALTVVAQCRMCTVEVEKMPKLQTACSTPAAEGMVVHTQSPKAKKNRESVMEFLLINHPLDCPICDKSGECDLQDNSFGHGSPYMRYTEERRTYVDLDMGPVIQKNMNRCIHCTRCIRFGDEVAKIHEMVAVKRGNNTEITTLDGKPLQTDYAGNYADICPTGSLTLKEFRFHKRAWMLKRTPTVCEGCSRGCNMEVHQDGNVIYRCLPKHNPEINKYWLCDEGRFNYNYVQSPERIKDPVVAGQLTDWTAALAAAKSAIGNGPVSVLVGSDLTQEELQAVQDFAKHALSKSTLHHFGTAGISSAQQDGHADKILKMKNKTANLFGADKLGIPGMPGDADGIKIPTEAKTVLVFRGGRASLPKNLGGAKVVGVGVFTKNESAQFAAVLPGLTFVEKEGTIFNFEGREQRYKRAIMPARNCKSVAEVITLWKGATS